MTTASMTSSGPLSTAEMEEALGLRIPVQTAKRNEPRSADAVRNDIRRFREKMGRANKKIPCVLKTADGEPVDAETLAQVAARKGFQAYVRMGKKLCRKLEKKLGVSKAKAEKLAKRAFAEAATKKVMRENNIVTLASEEGLGSWTESYCSNPVSDKHYKRRDVQDLARALRKKQPKAWAKFKKGSSESREKLCSAITKTLLDLDIVKGEAEARKVAEELAGPGAAPAPSPPSSPTPPEARKEVVEAAKKLAVAEDKQQEAVDKAEAGDKAGAQEAAKEADAAIDEAARASERAKEKGASDERVEQVAAAVEEKKDDQRSLVGGLAAGIAGAAAGATGWLFGGRQPRTRAERKAAEEAAAAAPQVVDLTEEDVFVDASEEPYGDEASVVDLASDDSVKTDELMAAMAFMDKFPNKTYSEAECVKHPRDGGQFTQKELMSIAKKLGYEGKLSTKPALCEFIHNATKRDQKSRGEPSVAEVAAADMGAVAPAGAAVVAAASESAGRAEYEKAIEYLQQFPYVNQRFATKAGRQLGSTKVYNADKCKQQPDGFKVARLAKLLGVDVSGKNLSDACSSSFSELDRLAAQLGEKNVAEKYRA